MDAISAGRDVAWQYGQANGIRYLPEDHVFIDPDFRRMPGSVLLNKVYNWTGKGHGPVARASITEMKRLFAVPRRPASPGVLADWTRAYEAFAKGEGQDDPSAWPEAGVKVNPKTGQIVIAPSATLPRVRLYVGAAPFWKGLRAGEWEPRPGRQNRRVPC